LQKGHCMGLRPGIGNRESGIVGDVPSVPL
jgi:hypothetical protein